MDQLLLGLCGVCNETRLFYKDKKSGRIIFTEEYDEITIALSNDTIARHGVCKKCIETLDDDKAILLFERICETWRGQYVGWASAKQFKKLNDLRLVGWASGSKKDALAKEYLKQHKLKKG